MRLGRLGSLLPERTGRIRVVPDFCKETDRGTSTMEIIFLNKHREGRETESTTLVQRVWRVPVWDVEAMMQDPDLFNVAKQIETSLGHRARFMLRPGDLSEIRILVEAPNEQKCLLAMLRFTRAAERKRYLTGTVEEEEL
jgi:hypothetical protein